MSEKKRSFQIIDEMNLEDINKNTQLVKISTSFVSGKTVKQGAIIEMGCDPKSLIDILSDEYMPILVIVKKKEYFKREKE